MATLFKYILLSIILLASTIYSINTIEKTMKIGDEITITTNSTSKVLLSKKGLVEIYTDNNGINWNLTAVRTGFLIISIKNNDDKILTRYKLNIKKIPTLKQKKTQTKASKLPAWICKLDSIKCKDNIRITGTTSDYNLFKFIQTSCKKIVNCFFELDFPSNILLKIQIHALEKNYLRQHGLLSKISLNRNSNNNPNLINWNSILQHMKQSNKSHTSAEYSINLTVAQEALLQGKLLDSALHNNHYNNNLSLKQTNLGSKLKVKVTPITNSKIKLDYDVNINMINSSKYYNSIGKYKGSINLKYQKKYIIGVLEISGNKTLNRGSTLFDNIPIISIFFKSDLKNIANVFLVLTVNIQKINT